MANTVQLWYNTGSRFEFMVALALIQNEDDLLVLFDDDSLDKLIHLLVQYRKSEDESAEESDTTVPRGTDTDNGT